MDSIHFLNIYHAVLLYPNKIGVDYYILCEYKLFFLEKNDFFLFFLSNFGVLCSKVVRN